MEIVQDDIILPTPPTQAELDRLQDERDQLEAESRRATALREALKLAKLRFDNGMASQLDVLDAERNLLAAQLNQVEALRAQRAAVASLFKALGGGWEGQKP